MSVDTKDKTKIDFSTLVDVIKFDNFYGRGGSFLITPLNEAKVFSKEMFTEDQKMFANAAVEYANTRLKDLSGIFFNSFKESPIIILLENFDIFRFNLKLNLRSIIFTWKKRFLGAQKLF